MIQTQDQLISRSLVPCLVIMTQKLKLTCKGLSDRIKSYIYHDKKKNPANYNHSFDIDKVSK